MSDTYNHHYQTMHITKPADNPFEDEPHMRRRSSAPTYHTSATAIDTASSLIAVQEMSQSQSPSPLPPLPPPVGEPEVPSYAASMRSDKQQEAMYGYRDQKTSTITLPFAIPHSIQSTLSAINIKSSSSSSYARPPPSPNANANLPPGTQTYYVPADGYADANGNIYVITGGAGSGEGLPPKKKSVAKKIAKDFGKGIGIVLLVPVAAAGVGVVAAGGVIYGVGLVIRGIGGVLTFGAIH